MLLVVFESHKGIAKCFEIPSTMVKDMQKIAVKIKQAFENSSYSTDAKCHRKTRCDDVDVALLALFEKTEQTILRWP